MEYILNFIAEHYKLLLFLLILLAFFALFVYDRYVQRKNQILINFPIIGHMRHFFYLLRDPMRQYFGDEKFYKSHDQIAWVEKASENKTLFSAFSPSKYDSRGKFLFKHANTAYNNDEVSPDFSVVFGDDKKYPFKTKSIIGRSAMSDGSISPEGTQAFAMGAYMAKFPINTGEGGLTSNFLRSQNCTDDETKNRYMDIKKGTKLSKAVYYVVKFFFNAELAKKTYRRLIIDNIDEVETYSFDNKKLQFFRIDWDQPLEYFPEDVPHDLPDIIFQMGSGLYGVRDAEGNFNYEKYKKIMRFSKMTEIKLAQGAKQTGGKLLASKVTPAVAYYRGIEPYKDVISPNRFPYATSTSDLFDYVGTLQEASEKPVGIKIVISGKENFVPIADELKKRIDEGKPYPDFITIDGGDGGSATAPLEMMTKVGIPIQSALYIVQKKLETLGIRDKVKIIASEKVLTPDDVLLLKCLGADFISIARGFMISAGCIRARECSGANGRDCPVGLATQNKKKRASFLTRQKSHSVANYHNNLIKGVTSLLAIMGLNNVKQANKSNLTYMKNNKIYFEVDEYFEEKLHTKII
ncbi:MAG: Ferredoxin-dependent glutamate synthase (EC [uncultured Campylobacterales bacterium]|uniref:Ferredoxin-dependent glutamate synthase (EC) n=1 Tax=uncultured Campylobacterales bacterium TaxID=352960 RepID=A0A6S6S791_9BACT|nr:MAG: Ferredoxin-dependent glutamate synthase (EC [uncultured Campylobacterales bacterium]